MEKFHGFLFPFFCLFFKAWDKSLQCKLPAVHSPGTCLVRSGLRAVGAALLALISCQQKADAPKWADCERLWHNCGISPGWNPTLLSLGKSRWWQTGQRRLKGYSFSCKLGMLRAVFCPRTDRHSLEIPNCSTPCMLVRNLPGRVLIGSPFSWAEALHQCWCSTTEAEIS